MVIGSVAGCAGASVESPFLNQLATENALHCCPAENTGLFNRLIVRAGDVLDIGSRWTFGPGRRLHPAGHCLRAGGQPLVQALPGSGCRRRSRRSRRGWGWGWGCSSLGARSTRSSRRGCCRHCVLPGRDSGGCGSRSRSGCRTGHLLWCRPGCWRRGRNCQTPLGVHGRSGAGNRNGLRNLGGSWLVAGGRLCGSWFCRGQGGGCGPYIAAVAHYPHARCLLYCPRPGVIPNIGSARFRGCWRSCLFGRSLYRFSRERRSWCSWLRCCRAGCLRRRNPVHRGLLVQRRCVFIPRWSPVVIGVGVVAA